MKIFNPKDLPSFLLPEKQCKFNRSCNFYSYSSYTCTHTGGEYCGKYRALLRTSQKDLVRKKSPTEENLVLA